MANVKLNWTLPAVNDSQRALSHVRVEGRAEGIPAWSAINEVAAPGTELMIQDLAPGSWEFRGIVVDVADEESAPVAASVDVPFAAPSPLQAFTATVE